MNNPPKVSIGLPVYNGAANIAVAVQELLDQDFPDFELIISDNASIDSTPEICTALAKLDKRIQFHRQRRNLGINGNFDWVLAQARGELFMWAAHDDGHLPSFISRCVAALDASPESILATTHHAVTMDDGTQYTHEFSEILASPDVIDRLRWIWRWGGAGIAYGLHRREVLVRTRPLSTLGSVPAPGVSPDQFVYELGLMGPFARVPEPLFEYRMRRLEALDAFASRLNPDVRFKGTYLWWLMRDMWRLSGRHSLPLSVRRRVVAEVLASARVPGMLHELLLHYNMGESKLAQSRRQWRRLASLRLERLALSGKPIELSPYLPKN